MPKVIINQGKKLLSDVIISKKSVTAKGTEPHGHTTEWAVRVIQGMYVNARSRVRVNGQYSEEFGVGVGVHQGSVLSPLLFILVLEALSREFRTGVPWELLYADDLVVIADSLEECISKLRVWKAGMESKGLRVNMKKTKFLISGVGLSLLQDSGEFPCVICRSGVGVNSIECSQCKLWVHKKCSGLTRNSFVKGVEVLLVQLMVDLLPM